MAPLSMAAHFRGMHISHGAFVVQVKGTVKQLLGSLSAADVASQRLALLCLGEIGRLTDLSGQPEVRGWGQLRWLGVAGGGWGGFGRAAERQ